jgi:hypothetical protein
MDSPFATTHEREVHFCTMVGIYPHLSSTTTPSRRSSLVTEKMEGRDIILCRSSNASHSFLSTSSSGPSCFSCEKKQTRRLPMTIHPSHHGTRILLVVVVLLASKVGIANGWLLESLSPNVQSKRVITSTRTMELHHRKRTTTLAMRCITPHGIVVQPLSGCWRGGSNCLRESVVQLFLSSKDNNDDDNNNDDGWDETNDSGIKTADRTTIASLQKQQQDGLKRKNPEPEPDLFIPIFTLVSIVGFVGAYGYETLRLALRGELYLPWN